MVNIDIEKLAVLVLTGLKLDSPVLSGNMKSHINIESVSDSEIVLSISGPSYDLPKWEETGQIIYTNEYDYALSVDTLGAFGGKSKKSKRWIEKSLKKSCDIKANEWEAEVVCNVQL